MAANDDANARPNILQYFLASFLFFSSGPLAAAVAAASALLLAILVP